MRESYAIPPLLNCEELRGRNSCFQNQVSSPRWRTGACHLSCLSKELISEAPLHLDCACARSAPALGRRGAPGSALFAVSSTALARTRSCPSSTPTFLGTTPQERRRLGLRPATLRLRVGPPQNRLCGCAARPFRSAPLRSPPPPDAGVTSPRRAAAITESRAPGLGRAEEAAQRRSEHCGERQRGQRQRPAAVRAHRNTPGTGGGVCVWPVCGRRRGSSAERQPVQAVASWTRRCSPRSWTSGSSS